MSVGFGAHLPIGMILCFLKLLSLVIFGELMYIGVITG